MSENEHAQLQIPLLENSSIPPPDIITNPSPPAITKTSSIGRLHFFSHFNLFKKTNTLASRKHHLKPEDINPLPTNQTTEYYEKSLFYHLVEQRHGRNTKFSLFRAILITFRSSILSTLLLEFISRTLILLLIWIFSQLLASISDQFILTDSQKYKWAGVLTITLLLQCYFQNHWTSRAKITSARIKAALLGLIYSRLIKSSGDHQTRNNLKTALEGIVERAHVFEKGSVYFGTLYLGIPMLLASAALLWRFFGVLSLFGLAYLLFCLLMQFLTTHKIHKNQQEQSQTTQARISLTKELIHRIKYLKMYTWELIFKESVNEVRTKETHLLKKTMNYQDFSHILCFSSMIISPFIIFTISSLKDLPLFPHTVFPTFLLFAFLKTYLLEYLAEALCFLNEAKSLFKDIYVALESSEIQSKAPTEPRNPENGIEFQHFSAWWSSSDQKYLSYPSVSSSSGVVVAPPYHRDSSVAIDLNPENNTISDEFSLHDITTNIKAGSLNAVIGTMGAGKSSLLLSIAGEMPRCAGNLRFLGRVAYIDKEPMVYPGTIRENIVFGRAYSKESYDRVVKACYLENDFKGFVEGDLTETQQRHITFTRGQKVRIALARAVYSNADIYLLDDALSVVDSRIAMKIYEEVFLGILKNKTRIVTVNHGQYMTDVENIIVMEKGRVIGQGNYDQIEEQGIDVQEIFSCYDAQRKTAQQGLSLDTLPSLKEIPRFDLPEAGGGERTQIREKSRLPYNKSEFRVNKVTPKTYKEYLRSYGSLPLTVITLLFFVLAQGIFMAYIIDFKFWITWALDFQPFLVSTGILIIALLLLYSLKITVFSKLSINASTDIHKETLTRIVRSNLEFFETNPLERILTRFSTDLATIDLKIPKSLYHSLTSVFSILSIILLLAIVNPLTLVSSFTSAFFIIHLARFTYQGIKQTKACELNTRRSIEIFLAPTFSGLIAIRTYSQSRNFKLRYRKAIDENLKANLAHIAESQFLSFFVDILYTLTITSVVFILMAFNSLDPNICGVCLSLVLFNLQTVQYGIKSGIETHRLMSSKARISTYCDVEVEPPLVSREDYYQKSISWPSQGKIEFREVSFLGSQKRKQENGLKNLSFQAFPGEKIGIIDHSLNSAGKNMIIKGLFRLQEGQRNYTQNYIKVDNINIRDVGLHLLRSSIAILHKRPILFSGSVRKNLDPLDQYSDQVILEALEAVNMREIIENWPGGLEGDMKKMAEGLSVGQKQLFCMVRVLLKEDVKVVILDNFSGEVDAETAKLIQKVIEERLEDCTVLNFTERLRELAPYDKVMVIDDEEKVEFNVPYKLLGKEVEDVGITRRKGKFASMVLAAGPDISKYVFEVAKTKYLQKKKKI